MWPEWVVVMNSLGFLYKSVDTSNSLGFIQKRGGWFDTDVPARVAGRVVFFFQTGCFDIPPKKIRISEPGLVSNLGIQGKIRDSSMGTLWISKQQTTVWSMLMHSRATKSREKPTRNMPVTCVYGWGSFYTTREHIKRHARTSQGHDPGSSWICFQSQWQSLRCQSVKGSTSRTASVNTLHDGNPINSVLQTISGTFVANRRIKSLIFPSKRRTRGLNPPQKRRDYDNGGIFGE